MGLWEQWETSVGRDKENREKEMAKEKAPAIIILHLSDCHAEHLS